MVGVAEGDQLVAAAAEGGDEEGGLVRLGAAVGEEDLVQLRRGHRPDPLGQLDLGPDQEERAGVGDPVELGLDRLVDLLHGVAAGDGGDAAEEVEVLPAGPVPDELPLAPPQLDRLVVEEPDAREERFPVAAQEVGGVVGEKARVGVGVVGHGGSDKVEMG